ncbi:hypothetical protein ABLE68_01190 [Nocardioides sp. CN2-186]|uniref:hypothetical protein n=1 Tax=Nocardioides tweenelious TaxID=3156607 RepID=UPI0032B3A714
MSRPRRSRRSAEATRDLMLRAGTRLAVDRLREADEDAASRALAHIRLTDVARVATEIERGEGEDRGAITTGAIYQFWSSQAAFQADLMVHVLTEEPLPAEDRLAARTLELIAGGGPIDDVLAELAIMAYRIARTTETYDLSLLFVPYSKLPRVGEALRKSYRDQAKSARPIYQALLMAGTLKVREPWQIDDMMSAISALHDGFRIQEHSGAVGSDEQGESVLAAATVAIFRAFTEPA